MAVTDVRTDTAALTMTVTSVFAEPPERVWRLWAEPRLLERWWGPPAYPATVEEHTLVPGGRVTYYMTGPEGAQPRGLWQVHQVAAGTLLEVEDAFADADGNPDPAMPTTKMRVVLAARPDGGTTMTVVSYFSSAEALTQLLEMGMEQGMREAAGQMDDVLAADAA